MRRSIDDAGEPEKDDGGDDVDDEDLYQSSKYGSSKGSEAGGVADWNEEHTLCKSFKRSSVGVASY